jgi:hypothetical protein
MTALPALLAPNRFGGEESAQKPTLRAHPSPTPTPHHQEHRPMAIKISKKIKGYSVAKPDDKGTADAAAAPTQANAPAHRDTLEIPSAEIIQMHERLDRPERLIGESYKIKSPLFEHALYVTINDIVLNEGTDYESRRPFEIFINSKNMDHFQWVVAITRIMSAVFRKGGDVTFLVEELKAVFDPRGGYFKAGGVYMPSIVAEIGAVVEDHLKRIGMIVDEDMSPEQRKLIAEKRAAYEARGAKKKSELSEAPAAGIAGDLAGAGAETAKKNVPDADDGAAASGYPPGATMCVKCNTKATIIMDGCATCLACGYSKCG